MKRGTQSALVGVVLLALAALSSVNRGRASKESDGNGAACCPLVRTFNQMSLATRTNGPVLIVLTNKEALTNQP